ncbi:CoA transferase [uncultured Shimia sp.]|uniref:CaiB/BaiF CoA transferase family protein n=1 Tax=uncultured Shimia sp. TaxID=573152 RepID=UPI0025D8E3B8|nr:CoA transferase [uncultured Shimia sp.]
MTRPLDGIKIVDLTNMLMAPYTTQVLGDMGADVIKVEPPEGDPIRKIGPYRNPGMGPIFLNTNRSKRSIVLDLKTQDGHAAVIELIKRADVLIYNRRPQVMERLGLSYEVAKAVNPRIIYAGIFGYGQEGPYAAKPAFDDLIQGAVAIPALAQQASGGDPVYSPAAIIDRGVGLWAVGQINAALFHQLRTGEGQRIDMPMFEMMATFVLGEHFSGQTYEPAIGPPGYARLLSSDRRPYPTKDGYVCVMVYTDRHWQAYFDALGTPEVFEGDPRFASMTTRTENIDSIYAELAETLLTRSSDEWLAFFDAADIPAMPLNTAEDLISDPHLNAVGFFKSVQHPSEGSIYDMEVPSTWSATQPAPDKLAPRLGEHSTDILQEIGFDAEQISQMMTSGATAAPSN